MIAAHWKQVLIVLVPINILAFAFFEFSVGNLIGMISAVSNAQAFFKVWAIGLALILLWIIGAACLAVLWHRLVLCRSKIWPPLGALGRYFWYAFLLSLILAIVSWLIFTVFGGVVLRAVSPTQLSQASFYWPFLVFSFVSGTLFTFFWIRFGLVLPASAIGDKDMTFVFSWFETQHASWSIFVLAFVEGVLLIAVEEVTNRGWFSGAGFFLNSFPVLLGLAALSVLYRDLETRTDKG